MTTARSVAAALARTQWTLLDAIAKLTDDRAEAARAVLEQLADAATREQFERDLVAELDTAVRNASDLLVTATTATHGTFTTTSTPAATTSTTGVSSTLVSVTDGGAAAVVSRGGTATVSDAAGLAGVVAEVTEAMEEHPGKPVRITWAVQQ